jgi:uncharacterized protein with NAD-binding domain and iron-sulfur cluster
VTFFNLVMSDFSIFAQYEEVRYAPLIKEYLYSELRHYIEFDYVPQGPDDDKPDDIDRKRCYLQTNVNEPLFTNQVGTWRYRPEATCAIENLFLAGDFCKTFTDVVTIEGAVVSGLIAAEALRQKANVGTPIEIIEPDSYPQPMMAALTLMSAPYVYAAKAWTMLASGVASRVDEMFPNG